MLTPVAYNIVTRSAQIVSGVGLVQFDQVPVGYYWRVSRLTIALDKFSGTTADCFLIDYDPAQLLGLFTGAPIPALIDEVDLAKGPGFAPMIPYLIGGGAQLAAVLGFGTPASSLTARLEYEVVQVTGGAASAPIFTR